MSYKKYLSILVILVIFCLWGESRLEKLFSQARSRIKEKDYISSYERIIKESPDGRYGHLARFELAKHYILRRDYEIAAGFLNDCSKKYVPEREYWKGKNYFHWGKYEKAINVLDTYILDSKNYTNVETSYLYIAESYIRMLEYYKALNILDELYKGRYMRQQKPLVFYKTGSTYEKVGDYETAVDFYTKMKVEFPYHPLTFNASDRVTEISDQGLLENPLLQTTSPEPEPVLEKVEMPKPKPKPKPKPEPKPKPKPEPKSELSGMFLQVGAFIKDHNLTRRVALLEGMGYTVAIDPVSTRKGTLYKVLVGPFTSENDLQEKQKKLRSQGMECFKTEK